MPRVGLIVNPYAGLGGRLGLKGSDGIQIIDMALAAGVEPPAERRAAQLLAGLAEHGLVQIITWGKEMGELHCERAGLQPVVLGNPRRAQTTGDDTRQAATRITSHPTDLLLFVGGDGTARDIYDAIGTEATVLGVPAGVKMYSACFTQHPARAASEAHRFLAAESRPTTLAEVLDLDEEKMRQDRVLTRLYGFLSVPAQKGVTQGLKAPSPASDTESAQAIAAWLANQADMTRLLIGPGSTTHALGQVLGCTLSLLGVDLVSDGHVIVRDGSESELLSALRKHPAQMLVVTPIGGQGFLFGRGNQQMSPAVIKRVGLECIKVIATPGKIAGLHSRPLLIDTGDEKLDRQLAGYYRILVGDGEEVVYPARPASDP